VTPPTGDWGDFDFFSEEALARQRQLNDGLTNEECKERGKLDPYYWNHGNYANHCVTFTESRDLFGRPMADDQDTPASPPHSPDFEVEEESGDDSTPIMDEVLDGGAPAPDDSNTEEIAKQIRKNLAETVASYSTYTPSPKYANDSSSSYTDVCTTCIPFDPNDPTKSMFTGGPIYPNAAKKPTPAASPAPVAMPPSTSTAAAPSPWNLTSGRFSLPSVPAHPSLPKYRPQDENLDGDEEEDESTIGPDPAQLKRLKAEIAVMQHEITAARDIAAQHPDISFGEEQKRNIFSMTMKLSDKKQELEDLEAAAAAAAAARARLTVQPPPNRPIAPIRRRRVPITGVPVVDDMLKDFAKEQKPDVYHPNEPPRKRPGRRCNLSTPQQHGPAPPPPHGPSSGPACASSNGSSSSAPSSSSNAPSQPQTQTQTGGTSGQSSTLALTQEDSQMIVCRDPNAPRSIAQPRGRVSHRFAGTTCPLPSLVSSFLPPPSSAPRQPSPPDGSKAKNAFSSRLALVALQSAEDAMKGMEFLPFDAPSSLAPNTLTFNKTKKYATGSGVTTETAEEQALRLSYRKRPLDNPSVRPDEKHVATKKTRAWAAAGNAGFVKGHLSKIEESQDKMKVWTTTYAVPGNLRRLMYL
jgi:hypothetical protein